MSFLAPLFLAALAGLAIPVLLHLIQKERRNLVPFPSLMFLRRIPYQTVQRRRIRHWLLLMMRLAALALIVSAFARPFLRRSDFSGTAAEGARELVVLLDRSYSMGYGDRWSRALAAARDAIDGLGPSERGSIVLFAAGAEVALRSTGDRGRLQAAIAGLQPSASGTRYGPALKLAGSILSESALPRREVVMISDFQRTGWRGAEGVRLPDGATIVPVSVSDENDPNLSVTPVTVQRGLFENQERVTITTGVVNHGDGASSTDVTLEVGGRAIQTRRVSLDAHGSTSVTFEPVTIAEPTIRASVRLSDDALVRDNVFHFVLAPEDPIRIILAERGGAPRESSLYLSRALAVGESPRFLTTIRQADSLPAEEVSRAAVIVLNDTPVAQATAERLQRFVEGGGGLLLAFGSRASWPGSSDILPALADAQVDRASGQPSRLGALEYGHPVFELFKAPRTGDFSAARFYGYRAVKPSPSARILARFDDGAPALLERKVGEGRVLMWTSTLDLFWNDLAVKPVFLPFVHRMIRHLGAYREPKPWRTVGDVVEPQPTAGPSSVLAPIVLTPAGQRLELGEEGADVLELTDQGFYEIRPQGRESEAPIVVASNVDLGESDLTGMDPKEVAAAAVGRAAGPGAAHATTVPTDEAQEAAQRFWWYLLFAGLLLLGTETLVANRSAV